MASDKVIIDLCSSDEEEEEVSGDENINEETEDDEEDDSSFSDDDSDWNQDDGTDSDMEIDEDYKIGENGDDDDDDDKVTRLLTAGSDLKALNVKECKAYLRKHGLRLSGTKPVFIERIVEHWRIKDGSGEKLYPRSSFAINCKGDVCKGDTVMFTQKVHQKYEKMKKSGMIMGRRTVAGQVVKESYGTAKQQHTFTIEVLWCEGVQKLPPLYPLLVKGRNLYRLMTLRQRWANEDDRVKVLSEKHNRGAAARKVMRERKIKLGYVFKDGRLQKPDHLKKPCQAKSRKNEKENQNQKFKQDIPANHSLVANPNQNPSQGHKNPNQLRNMNPPFHSNTSHSYAPQPHAPRPYAPPQRAPLTYAPRPYAPFNAQSHLRRPNIPPSHSYAYSTQQNQSIQRPPPAFYNGRPAFYNGRPTSNGLQGQPSFNSRANTHAMPVNHQRRPYQNHHTHHANSNNGYNYGTRDLDHFSNMMIGDTYRQSEDTRRPYKNHHNYHPNSNNGYNHGPRDL
ncbi:hypothetical protein AALP_AA8G507500 [Arabis alpina]|uniref:SAP domain-containing protein n=1 Tax=Arabis alpina TaxID=50452 RepID=A0A087GES7_ARAAL|nr:hypothetical protein AALP_AA8G507500 [Arabis alpina]